MHNRHKPMLQRIGFRTSRQADGCWLLSVKFNFDDTWIPVVIFALRSDALEYARAEFCVPDECPPH